MQLPIYQVDAFANRAFEGNPAAVIPLKEWLSDELMQQIAIENNLSETAYFIEREGHFDLRWFTPGFEVDLCGHATLATAHTIFEHLDYQKSAIHFHTKSGELIVKKVANGYQMDFPADFIKAVDCPDVLAEGLGFEPTHCYKGKDDYVVIVATEAELISLDLDFRQIAKLDSRGLIVTAPSEKYDFVSRCFFPQAGIDEDPVTGSAHTALTPYWANRLNKTSLSAKQISARGGEVLCELQGERVLLSGNAVTFLKGAINLNL